MRVFICGDIVGHPGCEILVERYPELKEKYQIDFAIANAENAAEKGSGVTQRELERILSSGIDAISGGDHTGRKKDEAGFIMEHPKMVRPANFPEHWPGVGTMVFDIVPLKCQIALINVQGRIFMEDKLPCPFKTVEQELAKISKLTKNVIVDFHAEATSEKVAMGWFLDGRVSAVVGTHTHVMTADERLLHEGTAYITDLGMTGPHDSVIGRAKEVVLAKFQNKAHPKMAVASNEAQINSVLIDIDESTGIATHIERLCVR